MSRNSILPRTFRIALVLICAVLTTAPLWAQQIQGLPRRSPGATLVQRIGVTDVTVSYHRPLAQDREIFGGLVPYGAVWRAGANDNTTVHFPHPVRVEGQDLAAGTYGLHMIPTEEKWTVIFSHTSTAWGSFSYDESEDALRVEVEPRKVAFHEALEYRFDDLAIDGATLALRWAEVEVPVRIEVETHDHALAKIRSDLRSLPRFSWMGWMSAANYCVQNDVHHEEALGWIDRSLGMEEHYQNLNVKARLLRQMDRGEEAEEIAEKVLSIANEAQVNALGYQSMGRGEAEKAIAFFEKNVKDYPDSWNVYDSLAECQATVDETAQAVANYEKALSMAPEAQHARIERILEGLKE